MNAPLRKLRMLNEARKQRDRHFKTGLQPALTAIISLLRLFDSGVLSKVEKRLKGAFWTLTIYCRLAYDSMGKTLK